MNSVARYSGVLAYSDGSSQQFAGHIDDAGNISANNHPEGAQALYNLSEAGSTYDVFTLLSGTVSLSTAAGTAKTITGAAIEFSGRVAYTNGNFGDWIVQYTDQTGLVTPSGGAASHFADALADSEALAALTALLEDINWGGTTSVSASSVEVSSVRSCRGGPAQPPAPPAPSTPPVTAVEAELWSDVGGIVYEPEDEEAPCPDYDDYDEPPLPLGLAVEKAAEPATEEPATEGAEAAETADDIESLGLKADIVKTLRDCGLNTVQDLNKYKAEYGSFLPIDGIGPAYAKQIESALAGQQ